MVAASTWLFAVLGAFVLAAAGVAAYLGARRFRRRTAPAPSARVSVLDVELFGESQYSLTLQNVGTAGARDVRAYVADERLPTAKLSNEAYFGALAPGERRSRILGIRDHAAAMGSVLRVATSWREGHVRPRRHEPQFSNIRLPPLPEPIPVNDLLAEPTGEVQLPPPPAPAQVDLWEEPEPVWRPAPFASHAEEPEPAMPEVVPDVVTEPVAEQEGEQEAEPVADPSPNGPVPSSLPEAGLFVFDRVQERTYRGERHSLILERLDVNEPGDRFVLGSVGSNGTVDLYEWLLEKPLTNEEREEVERAIRS